MVMTLQDTMNRLLLLIRAGYPVIYIVSHEESRVLDYLAKIFRVIQVEEPGKTLWLWYAVSGLQRITLTGGNAPGPQEPKIRWLEIEGIPPVDARQGSQIPPDAANDLSRIVSAATTDDISDSLTVFFDVHHFLRADSSGLVRPLRNAATNFRRYYENRSKESSKYKTIVIVAPSADNLSPELTRDLIVLDFPLPETDELRKTLNAMIDGSRLRFPSTITEEEAEALFGKKTMSDGERGSNGHTQLGNEVPSAVEPQVYESRLRELIANAGRGLTLDDYKSGLNMFAAQNQELCAQRIEDMLNLKAKAITNPALQYTPHVTIELGGLEEVKAWIAARRSPAVSAELRQRYRLPALKGIMLCGASGGGKSQLAKLIAKQFNLALLRLDVGALFGQFVGESEERTRRALQLAEVLAPVVLWLDEVDKAFTGIGSSGDNGVSARVFGHFLTWLAEKQDSVFVVATANKHKALLDIFPEFGRKGRFDEIFWVPLPDQPARQHIFNIYLRKHFNDGYLTINEGEIDAIAASCKLDLPLGSSNSGDGEEILNRFCQLLSQPKVSLRMTGAEIEYAITESLYNAYRDSQKTPGKATFTPEMIVATVMEAKRKQLYGQNEETMQKSDALAAFMLDQADAVNVRYWPLAGKLE